MAFTEMTDDLDIIAKYPDEPYEEEGFTPSSFKASFDQGAKLCKAAHNVLVRALNAVTAAASLGFNRSAAVPADTVQAAIENVQAQLASASQGAVPNGSITNIKIATDADISGEKLADSGVGISKLAASCFAQDVTEDVTVSVEASTEQTPETVHFKFFYSQLMNAVFFVGDVEFAAAASNQVTYGIFINFHTDHKPAEGFDSLSVLNNKRNCTASATLQRQVTTGCRVALVAGDFILGLKPSVKIAGWYFCDAEEE